MTTKKMAASIIAIMMFAAIFVTTAAAFTAPNAKDDRVEFEYSEGNCDGLYVNLRDNCTDPQGPDMPTLRIYGEGSVDAAFPYTDPEGPFDPTNDEAPGKDFVVFNPAYISEAEYGADKEIIVNSADANQKVFAKQWYVPEYPEPRGYVWKPQEIVYSANIVTEYSYMLLDINNMPVAGTPIGTNFWFPIGSKDGQIGLDSFDLTTGTWSVPVDDPTMVSLKDVGYYNSDNRKDITIETRDPVRLYDTGIGNPDEWIEFLDHRIYVTDVTQVAGDDWAATIDVYYIGSDNEVLIQSGVDIVVGDGPVAFGRHTYHPDYDLCFERPWYIEAYSHSQDWVGGTLLDSVKVRVGRRLHTAETFFVDGAEYDVAMIYGPNSDDFKYITIRNPTPKCIPGEQGDITLSSLSVVKKCVPSCEVMPMLPPFNMDHTMVDDINLHDCYTGCSVDDVCDIISDDLTDLTDRQISVGPLKVMWYSEDVELRFHTNLLEILKEQTPEIWQWIHIHIMPDQYTEMVYPPLPDATVCASGETLLGDFLLVSSWEAPNSCDDRMKFAYDALDSSDIYVNEQDECGTNSVRIYGEGSYDAAFPYTDAEGPFNKLSVDAPRKDFVTFNPAYISEAAYGVNKEIIVNSADANENVFVRQWYVPKYPEPRGDVWKPQEIVYSANIVTEYSYMLLDINNMPVAGTPIGTNFWFPIGSRDGQIGLDSFDLTTGTWSVPVDDPTMVSLKDVGDYNVDGMKDITIETRDPVRLYDTNPDEWIEFLDHRIYVTDVAQVAGSNWAATVDVYYIGNDGESLIQGDVDIIVGAGPVAFGRHSYHPAYDLCFERPWYIEAYSHSQDWVGGTLTDSVKVRVGRRLHMNETFFVDGAEYDIAMIYGPNADDFKYITLRNPTPKYNDVTLGSLSIVKKHVDECDQLPMLPPFNMNHAIVDDIGIPHTCPTDGGNPIYGDYIQDEPIGIYDCANTVAKRIVPNQPAFVSYFVEETVEARFRTNLLEILDEDAPESWDMLCMWTLPWSYTAMVYPDVGDMTNCGTIKDADFIVTTSGPKDGPGDCKGDSDGDGDIDFWDFMDFVDAYDTNIGEPGYNVVFDFDEDGNVDFWDFMDFVDVYDTQCP